MKIIKHGNPKYTKPDRRFECSHCGCIFEAEYDEYKYAGFHNNEEYYKCNCPECNSEVYYSY